MAITKDDSGSVTLTGEHIRWYGRLHLRAALDMEIHGMRVSRVLAGPRVRRIIEQDYDGVTPARSKKKLLAQYDEYLHLSGQISDDLYNKWRARYV